MRILLHLLLLLLSTSHIGSSSISSLIQCPYSESACVDDINCDHSAMGKRAGYFCNKWPFYSGGFAECCDTNIEEYQCTHAVYSYETNQVFCDFWYMYQQKVADELQLCDCKQNNNKYCTSWICTTISHYDFSNIDQQNNDVLSKLLLPNQVEIFGVHQCGIFDDHVLINNNVEIEQYCYKYDDFKSCFCVPSDGDANYCENWICHKYLNNAKNDLDLEKDYNDPNYQNYWNISDYHNITITNESSAIDMLRLSTEVSREEYRCTMHHSNTPDDDNPVDESECTQWVGNLKFKDDRFAVQECGTTAWNPDDTTFRDFDPETQSQKYKQLDEERGNVTYEDLKDTYSFKWECKESGMDYRNNKQFLNFYLSTIIWSIGIGFILLFLIRCYMRSKYISLSSFFCVQGWFFFIFGSIAAVHGGFTSFFIYFCLQFIIFAHIAYVKCKNKGKQPYGSVQRFDFDPIEESMTRDRDDDKL